MQKSNLCSDVCAEPKTEKDQMIMHSAFAYVLPEDAANDAYTDYWNYQVHERENFTKSEKTTMLKSESKSWGVCGKRKLKVLSEYTLICAHAEYGIHQMRGPTVSHTSAIWFI